jgi:hypothetical protein
MYNNKGKLNKQGSVDTKMSRAQMQVAKKKKNLRQNAHLHDTMLDIVDTINKHLGS